MILTFLPHPRVAPLAFVEDEETKAACLALGEVAEIALLENFLGVITEDGDKSGPFRN